jgi:amino acid transporter
LLVPLGVAGVGYLAPIVGCLCVILAMVALSYRQTIAAYPDGGGSYTVAKENLGPRLGVLAASALALDYLLNVAVAISAGVGALVSAVPALFPYTLPVCLVLLALITLLNLRGVREAGVTLAVPTFAFVVLLGVVLVLGVVRVIRGEVPARAVPIQPQVEVASTWLIVRAFASGTTAMTGVEAVSNAVPLFRDPSTLHARRTLTAIVAILIALLVGIAVLCRAYGIVATEPGRAGYESVLSMVVRAVVGRGALYHATIAAILAVLALSANTSFADFPRLCRLLALDSYLPKAFAERGRRLVFTHGILVLAVLAAALLVGFGGVTDRLIPLFAIGALLAFTLSQAGMVVHGRRTRVATRVWLINLIGAIATGATVVIVAVSKFVDGAWLVILVVPLGCAGFSAVRRHFARVDRRIALAAPIAAPARVQPIAVVAAGSWNKVTQHGLAFALGLTDEVYVAQIKTEHVAEMTDELDRVITPGRRPHLVVLPSPFRELYTPFIELVRDLERRHPDRRIAVILPELVVDSWFQSLFHANRARMLQLQLLGRCCDQTVVIVAPYHVHD